MFNLKQKTGVILENMYFKCAGQDQNPELLGQGPYLGMKMVLSHFLGSTYKAKVLS
jgi:hypothetical protein